MSSTYESSLKASIAAHSRWANVTDRAAATRPMRDGFEAKLLREARERLGPDATDQQVAEAAENARKAHYARMQLKSLQVRQAKAARR